MLLQQFMRIPEFNDIPPSELRALAARSHVLCMPQRRWLLRAGRHIDAYFYLLKGSVETLAPRRKWRASQFGELQHFYPGCEAARTLGAVQVLRIDTPAREFLLDGRGGAANAAANIDPWLQKFLSSHMMQQLHVRDWQRLMAAFQRHEIAAGAKILCHGQPGSHCYVVERGHAVVHRQGSTLSHLCPGDFFGEDALVLNSVRNADVTALETMRVHAVDREVFARVLLDKLVQFVNHHSHGVLLTLNEDSRGVPVCLPRVREQAAQLSAANSYYISGGQRRQRALVALLLVQRGIRAYPLEDAHE